MRIYICKKRDGRTDADRRTDAQTHGRAERRTDFGTKLIYTFPKEKKRV